jgi:hypothetical protein
VISAAQDPVAEQDESGAAVHLALDHLRFGVHALGPAVVKGKVTAVVTADELDEIGWDARDLAGDGTVPYQACAEAFRRARAPASVGFALDSSPLTAALEGLYEAQAAASLDAVRLVVTAALE